MIRSIEKWNLVLAPVALTLSTGALWQTFVNLERGTLDQEIGTRFLEVERGLASTKDLLRQAQEGVRELQITSTPLVMPSARTPREDPIAPSWKQEEYQHIVERMDEMELRLAAASHRYGGEVQPIEPEGMKDLLASELGQDAIREYQHIFADSQAPWSHRVDALRMLRRFPTEANVFTPRVLSEALSLLQSTDDPRKQSQIIKAVEGLREPAIRDELLRLARESGNDHLRARAVEALATYQGEPAVKNLLASIMNSDLSMKVRHEAEKSLR